MYTIKTTVLVTILGFFNFTFFAKKAIVEDQAHFAALNDFNQELCAAYNAGENLILVDQNGTQYYNPNREDLLNLAPEVFSENRVRVTLNGRSDNDLCSTELVISGASGGIVGNYAVNSCSSYGWIFFTSANCFDVALFHDAGLEAPYGNAINGSVDWTFQFNDKSRITGTYTDMGAANMYKVASPCYNAQNKEPLSAAAAKTMDVRRRSAPLGY